MDRNSCNYTLHKSVLFLPAVINPVLREVGGLTLTSATSLSAVVDTGCAVVDAAGWASVDPEVVGLVFEQGVSAWNFPMHFR